MLRIFLTDLIEGSGQLGLETSACIRTGMGGVDLRALLASGPEGGGEAAMVGSMSAFILTLMCLSEEEWQATAPSLGAAPEERENLQCLLEKMGGPEGFAETLGRRRRKLIRLPVRGDSRVRRADGGSPGRIDGDRARRGSGSPDGDELLGVKAGTLERVGAEGRVGGASHFPPF